MFQVIVVVLLLCISLSLCSNRDAERAETLRIDNSRLESQDQILAELLSVDDFYVTRFVADWRNAYPQPSGQNLSELRQIEQKIKMDRSSAMKFTLDYHQHNDFRCQVSRPLSISGDQCNPGL